MAVQTKVPTMQHEEVGRGEPLVLIGGGLTGWQSWVPHVEALAPTHRVIRLQPLAVGLGLTGEPLPANYSIGYEADAMSRTVDELGLKEADFAAWSYGGGITLSYAIHHPEKVRSLTLIEPAAHWVTGTRGPLDEADEAERAFFRSLPKDSIREEQLAEFLRFVGMVPKGADPRVLPQWPNWLKHRQSLRFGDAPYRHKEDLELVRRFDKPVLLVKGEGSTRVNHAIVDVLAGEFPRARVIMLPAGHAPHIVSMPQFLDLLRDFLAEVDRIA